MVSISSMQMNKNIPIFSVAFVKASFTLKTLCYELWVSRIRRITRNFLLKYHLYLKTSVLRARWGGCTHRTKGWCGVPRRLPQCMVTKPVQGERWGSVQRQSRGGMGPGQTKRSPTLWSGLWWGERVSTCGDVPAWDLSTRRASSWERGQGQWWEFGHISRDWSNK